MRIKAITTGALTIALVCVFFMIFKGPTNIFNALLVPLVLYGCLRMLKQTEGYTIMVALLFLCSLLFKVQIVFALFYCLAALVLLNIRVKKWPFLYEASLLSLIFGLSFWISVAVTDALFLTHMGEIMGKALRGNPFAYAGLLAFEGILVGTGLVYGARKLEKRLKRIGM